MGCKSKKKIFWNILNRFCLSFLFAFPEVNVFVLISSLSSPPYKILSSPVYHVLLFLLNCEFEDFYAFFEKLCLQACGPTGRWCTCLCPSPPSGSSSSSPRCFFINILPNIYSFYALKTLFYMAPECIYSIYDSQFQNLKNVL